MSYLHQITPDVHDKYRHQNLQQLKELNKGQTINKRMNMLPHAYQFRCGLHTTISEVEEKVRNINIYFVLF